MNAGIPFYTTRYRYVDDAIKEGDENGVRELMGKRDSVLVYNIHNVAKYLGEKNMCISDLLLLPTPTHRMETVYSDIAHGAAKGGHKDLVMDMVKRGANDWNWIATGAAEGGHKDLVIEMVKMGATNHNRLASRALKHGYQDIALEMLEMGADNWDDIAYLAARHGYKDMLIKAMENGAENWNWMVYEACKGGHKDILIEMAIRDPYTCSLVLNIAHTHGYTDIVDSINQIV